jgi:hypothetical protein
MYTEGIRKIYSHNGMYGSIDKICELAEDAGFKALTHNGLIYVFHTRGGWFQTDFTIEDFKAN